MKTSKTSECPTIRVAKPADLPAIEAITAGVFYPFAIDWHIEQKVAPAAVSWLELKMAVIRHEMKLNPDGCFVAELAGAVVGYVTTTINALASRGVIANVAVGKAAQGHGVGRLLLERAIQFFRRRKLRQAKIETLESNVVGQHLYPSLGFREVARQIHYVMPLTEGDMENSGNASTPAAGG